MNTLLMIGSRDTGDRRLHAALEFHGFAVATATQADDLDDFEPEETAAVVVHLNATRGDAFRVMYRIRRSLPRMPIIAIAPFRDSVVEQHAKRCGASFVLVEPLHHGDLAAFIVSYSGLSAERAMA